MLRCLYTIELCLLFHCIIPDFNFKG